MKKKKKKMCNVTENWSPRSGFKTKHQNRPVSVRFMCVQRSPEKVDGLISAGRTG